MRTEDEMRLFIVIATIITAIISGCTKVGEPTPEYLVKTRPQGSRILLIPWSANGSVISTDPEYIMDDRTKLCFARFNGGSSYTYVPCNIVFNAIEKLNNKIDYAKNPVSE